MYREPYRPQDAVVTTYTLTTAEGDDFIDPDTGHEWVVIGHDGTDVTLRRIEVHHRTIDGLELVRKWERPT